MEARDRKKCARSCHGKMDSTLECCHTTACNSRGESDDEEEEDSPVMPGLVKAVPPPLTPPPLVPAPAPRAWAWACCCALGDGAAPREEAGSGRATSVAPLLLLLVLPLLPTEVNDRVLPTSEAAPSAGTAIDTMSPGA